jgi:Kef-type K+ transport system membrane component KefB
MPLEVILVPIFFVLMGLQVKLETFLQQDVMLLAAGLLVAALSARCSRVLVPLGLRTGWLSVSV